MVSFSDEVVTIGTMTFKMPFENVIIPLESEQLAELENSIKELGVQVPILIDQHDRVIDGHNRLRLALKHGITEVPVERIQVKDDDHAKLLVIELNLKRRHMNAKQRSMLAEMLIKMYPDKPASQIGEMAGVSPHTVGKVKDRLDSDLQNANEKKVVNRRNQKRPAKYKPRKSATQKAAEEAQASLNGREHQSDEQEPQVEEPAELLDQAEQSLPPQAYEAFNQLPEIRELSTACDRLVKEVERVSQLPVGRCLLVTTIVSQIRAVKQNINSAKPAYICPYCRGDKKNCTACAGSGWVTTTTWKQAPPEMKEIQRAGKESAE